MSPSLLIDPRALPAEGRSLTGSLPLSIFDLPNNDQAQPKGPLEFELTVTRDDDDLILQGNLSALFEFDCARCLNPVQYVVEVPDYDAEIPIENDQMIDLTNWLREDILLALPDYPRCEDGNVSPRKCPAVDNFEKEVSSESDSSATQGNTGVWDSLDKLK